MFQLQKTFRHSKTFQ